MTNTLCMKCKEFGSVVLRGKDTYCQKCFLANVTHKVRSSLGKNKLMRSHEKVLLTLSGGCSSTTMLDILNNAIKLDTHKKLRVEAICLHVMGCERPQLPVEKQQSIAKKLIDTCDALGVQIHIVHLSDLEYDQIPDNTPNTLPILNNQNIEKVDKILASTTPTSRTDYIYKMRQKVFIKYAEKLKCDYIFVADSAVTMATNMLSGIVVGRGKQVEHDVGFCDSRNKINILRPMKGVTLEEIKDYIAIKKLEIVHNSPSNNGNSLQNAIQSFVMDLQDNFQATISTVCKTADKIGIQSSQEINTHKICTLCESPLNDDESKLTALQATNFSRAISTNPKHFNDETNVRNNLDYKNVMFPLINEVLCYGCSRTYSEFKEPVVFKK